MFNLINFIFLGTIGWGVSLFLIKILLHCLSPIEIVLYRAVLGTVALWALVWLSGIKFTNYKTAWRDGFIMAVFNMALPFYLISKAEQTVSGSLSSVINAMTPMFTVLIGMLFFSVQTRLSYYLLASIVLGLTGVLLIDIDALRDHHFTLDLVGLVLACVSYAIYLNYQKRIAPTNPPILIAAIATTLTAFIMLLFEWQSTVGRMTLPDQPNEWFVLGWLGLVATGASMYLYCLLINRAGAIYASMVTYLMTATSVVAGVILFHEQLTPITITGCLCIMLSLCLMNLKKQH